MKVLIIEDEIPAAEKLSRYLAKYDASIVVTAHLTSVQEAVDWLQENRIQLDFIFMDIQLTDGLSFQIFPAGKHPQARYFHYGFNEFALDASVNSIDYLLKPITFTDLSSSLKSFDNCGEQLQWSPQNRTTSRETFVTPKTTAYKNRFMVFGDHIRSITSDQIALFYADGRDVPVTTQNRSSLSTIHSETLEDLLEPKIFSGSTAPTSLTSTRLKMWLSIPTAG